MPEPLSLAAIEAADLPKGYHVTVLGETDSTNLLLRRRAAENAPHGTVAFAEAQTAGRGRLGRSFFSPPGAGLYMSLLLRPSGEPTGVLGLTAFAAVATARAIERVSGVCPAIKWVNDLYLDGRKVCGILAEGEIDPDSGRFRYVILGIGINVTPAALPKELRSIAISLEESAGHPVSRNDLAAALLAELSPLLRGQIPSGAIDEYRRRDCVSGKRITVLSGDTTYTAFAEGIEEDGALRVRRESGEVLRLSSGEISIRPL